jgi:drug/metabolite transporter (DMT)-like permease
MVPAMRRKVDAGLVLLLTPVLWGATFPATKLALRTLPVPTFMAWSRTLGFLTVLAMLPLLRRPGSARAASLRAAIWPGLLLGSLMFVGYFLQTEGQARTTATNAGFITGTYVVFVPLTAAVIFRHRPRRSAWTAVLVSLIGLTLLSITNLETLRPSVGDLLVLAGALAWAGHIVAVSHFAPRLPAWLLSLAQLGAAAALHVVAASGTGARFGDALGSRVLPLLIITGVLGTGVAFTIQVAAQRTVTATRAVVLLAGESIFAAAFAAAWLGERLAGQQWIGALLVLGAMAYSELRVRRPAETRLDPAAVP